MARVSTYLNYPGTTEAAFNFYKSVFGTEFAGPVMRMGDSPQGAGLSDDQKRLVMHVALPIAGGHVLMGTDAVESMGHPLKVGNNFSISVDLDTPAEAETLFPVRFVPLVEERFDLLVERRSWFEPPFQAFARFCAGRSFREKAAELGGYDVEDFGVVHFNGA